MAARANRRSHGPMLWLLAAFASLLASLAAAAAAQGGRTAMVAHPLTINVTPDPITSGDPALIYGQLNVPHPGGRTIVLHERINPAPSFSVEETTSTDAAGFYEFTAASGVATTNRSWYTTWPGAITARSRTVHEAVAAALTLEADAAVGSTNHPLRFSGVVAPAGVHAGELVFLQRQGGGSGDTWNTIGQGMIDASSTYSITRTFLLPGAVELRVAFDGDARNAKASSDPLTIVIQQAVNPSFTLGTSAPTLVAGGPVTISGVLYAPGSTSVPLPATSVTLWGHQSGGTYGPITSTTTGPDGSYSFTETPSHDEAYDVRTTFRPPPRRISAQLFVGVADVPTLGASATSATLGEQVTFTGTVTPDKAGASVSLEELGSTGAFHVVATGTVDGSSTFAFKFTFGSSGAKSFRVLVPGDATNIAGVSPTLAVAVSLPPVTLLPRAS